MNAFIKVLLLAIIVMFVVTGINVAITHSRIPITVKYIGKATPAISTTDNSSGGILSLGIVDTSPLSSLNYFSPISDFYFSTILYLPFAATAYPPAPGLEPVLAEGWSHNKNFTIWNLTLKNGLKWDNGSPLNSTDLAFSLSEFQKLGDLEDGSSITNISILNSTTVLVKTNSPQPNLIYDYVSTEDATILPYSTYKDLPTANISSINNFNNIISDAPYVIYNYTPGENPITFVPNKYYYRGTPYYKQLSIRIFSTFSSEVASYKSGKLAAIWNAGPYNETVPLFSLSGYSVSTQVPAHFEQLMFNLHDYPFNITNFRIALAYLLNRTEINSRVNSNDIPLPQYDNFEPGQGVTIGLNNTSIPNYSYNFTQAKKLLGEIGIVYTNGKWEYESNGTQLSFNIVTAPYGTGNIETASLVSSELNSAGFSTTVTVETYSTLEASIVSSSTGWQMGVAANFYGTLPSAWGELSLAAEADNSTAGVYGPFNGVQGWNGTYFSELVNTAGEYEIGSPDAVPFLDTAAIYLAKMVPFIPIFQIDNYVGYGNSIYWGNETQHTGLFNLQNNMPSLFWYSTLYYAHPITHPVSRFPFYVVIPVIVVVVLIAAVISVIVIRNSKNINNKSKNK